VFLHFAADALQWCGASRAEPLPLEGLRERFLPEASFRGWQNAKFQYAVLAAAGVHGGIEPLWVARIDPQLAGSPNCLSRSIAALTCVRKRLTADCTDGSAA
jgi:hypothetical protein